MSTLTQCPACGTLFKVVPDQLRVSNGWVRCGSCGEAFEARKYYAAALASVVATDAAAAESVAARRNAGTGPDPVSNVDAIESIAIEDQNTPTYIEKSSKNELESVWKAPPEAADAAPEAAPEAVPEVAVHEPLLPVATQAAEALPGETEPSQHATPSDDASLAPSPEPDRQSFAEPGAPSFAEPDAALQVEPKPQALPNPTLATPPGAAPHADSIGFLREAKRRAFWRKGWVRAALGAVVLALAVGLGLQIVYHERDRIAAARPDWIPHLQQMCAHLDCKLRPLRAIDAVAIDSHAFNLFKGDVYRLRIALKNTSGLTVALPSVELTLTNAQEETVGRRVLMPIDLGVIDTLPQLAPGQEFSANLMIQLGPELAAVQGAKRVAGYSVYTFYP